MELGASSSRQSANFDSSSCGSTPGKMGRMESLSVATSREEGVKVLKDNEKDAQYLLAIFPEEIWSLIFEKFEDPEDLERTSNSSPFFRKVLSSKRVLFLFVKVWKVLDFKYHQTDSLPPEDDDDDEEEDGEMNMADYKKCEQCERWKPKWWFSATFALRGVCHTWCNGVDTLLQRRWSQYSRIGAGASVSDLGKTCLASDGDISFNINNIGKVESFIDHFMKTHPPGAERSPFLSKRVELELQLEDSEERQHIPRVFLDLLSKFGHHIQYADLSIGPEFSCYTDLRQLLGLLPNLKMLNLWFDDDGDADDDSVENLESEIRQNPLPHLRTLQFMITNWATARIFNELIQSNGHISELQIESMGENYHGVYDFYTTTLFANLKYFSMQMYSVEQLMRVINAMKDWPLCKLDLRFGRFMDWSQLFTELEENLPKTLTDLRLELPHAKEKLARNRILEECASLRLNLPQIKHLNLLIDNLSSLDFLIPMKDSLENLNIFLWINYEDEDEVVKNDAQQLLLALESTSEVKLLSYSGRLLDSNVWDLFPKLKTLGLSTSFYLNGVQQFSTRKEWEKKFKTSHEVAEELGGSGHGGMQSFAGRPMRELV